MRGSQLTRRTFLQQSAAMAAGAAAPGLLARGAAGKEKPGWKMRLSPTDFTPWLAALAKAGYAWYVNPFMHHEPEPDVMSAALAKSRDYLKACYARA